MIRYEDSIWNSVPSLKVEMAAFEHMLRDEFAGGSFIQTAASELIFRGGKRLRPAMTIAAAHMGQYDQKKAFPIAMAIEAIHTATLVHDDVIDHAETRRGETTLHALHGNHIAIYTGDFLLARGLKQIARSGLAVRDMARIADAVEVICTGEVSQYLGRNKLPGYRAYLRRIMSKTGILFAASASFGGYCSALSDEQMKTLWHFGMRYGAAFQILDDIIDMDENQKTAGKPTGNDLLEGIVTLPVLFAAADKDYRHLLNQFFTGEREPEKVKSLIRLARELGAIDQTKEILRRQTERCQQLLLQLPDTEGRTMLKTLVQLLEI